MTEARVVTKTIIVHEDKRVVGDPVHTPVVNSVTKLWSDVGRSKCLLLFLGSFDPRTDLNVSLGDLPTVPVDSDPQTERVIWYKEGLFQSLSRIRLYPLLGFTRLQCFYPSDHRCDLLLRPWYVRSSPTHFRVFSLEVTFREHDFSVTALDRTRDLRDVLYVK